MSKLQEKTSALKREHPALQNMKFINFFYFVGNFCPPRSWSNPDPLHCKKDLILSYYKTVTGNLNLYLYKRVRTYIYISAGPPPNVLREKQWYCRCCWSWICFRFNIKTLEHRGFQLNIWDVGGQKSLRSERERDMVKDGWSRDFFFYPFKAFLMLTPQPRPAVSELVRTFSSVPKTSVPNP